MKIPQYTILDHEKLREAQQIIDEIMDDVTSPLHNTKHSRHKQVKEAVAALENEIFLLACNLDGQFQDTEINTDDRSKKLDPVQNSAQDELYTKRRNRRSKQDLIKKPRVMRRKIKGSVLIENNSGPISRYDSKM
ncbi:MAG: hypothetical protein PHG00_02750 [Methylococcales bacterium]|nr:hypothetical protein [Methylococcales bacterium]